MRISQDRLGKKVIRKTISAINWLLFGKNKLDKHVALEFIDSFKEGRIKVKPIKGGAISIRTWKI